jgi:hypothetical protein
MDTGQRAVTVEGVKALILEIFREFTPVLAGLRGLAGEGRTEEAREVRHIAEIYPLLTAGGRRMGSGETDALLGQMHTQLGEIGVGELMQNLWECRKLARLCGLRSAHALPDDFTLRIPAANGRRHYVVLVRDGW